MTTPLPVPGQGGRVLQGRTPYFFAAFVLQNANLLNNPGKNYKHFVEPLFLLVLMYSGEV